MPSILTTRTYERRLKKFIKLHPELRSKYVATIKLLAINPNHPSLHLHKLKGQLSNLHAVSLTYKYRISLTFLIKKDKIMLVDIGTHDQVY